MLPQKASAAQSSNSLGSSALQMVWALLVVVGLILVIYAIARKRMGLGHSGRGVIKIREIRHLQPKASIVLVEVRDRELLLGVGNGQIELLADMGKRDRTDFEKIMDESTQ
ncbi:FliO/MopB family protein [Desulfolithobacter sp.]